LMVYILKLLFYLFQELLTS